MVGVDIAVYGGPCGNGKFWNASLANDLYIVSKGKKKRKRI